MAHRICSTNTFTIEVLQGHAALGWAPVGDTVELPADAASLRLVKNLRANGICQIVADVSAPDRLAAVLEAVAALD